VFIELRRGGRLIVTEVGLGRLWFVLSASSYTAKRRKCRSGLQNLIKLIGIKGIPWRGLPLTDPEPRRSHPEFLRRLRR
jgi:hypothetical protein